MIILLFISVFMTLIKVNLMFVQEKLCLLIDFVAVGFDKGKLNSFQSDPVY